MLDKLFKLLGYEKVQLEVEEPKANNNEPTLDSHIVNVTVYHNSNFNKIEQAISHTHRDLEELIASSGTKESEDTLVRLNTLMLGIWCESRLHKLTYEKNLFSEDERKTIYSASSLEEKWKKSLEVALRRNKALDAGAPLNVETLDFALFQVYSQIKRWIDIYFSPVIRLRNKVAHSQWVNPFKNYQNGWNSSWTFQLCTESKGLLFKENVLTLKYKHDLLKRIATAINNLSLVNSDYEVQDFDSMYAAIIDTESKLSTLKNKTINEYREKLINKHNYQKKCKQTALEKAVTDKLELKYELVLK